MTVKLALAALLLLSACENTLTRSFGGKSTILLRPGEKLVNVTWKESNLWFLVRQMKPGETPETYGFVEKSTLGLAEGTVVIKESR